MSIYLVIIALVVVAVAAAVALAAIVCVCGMLSSSFPTLLSLPVCICVSFIHFHTHTCSFCSLYNWNKIYLWLFVARCFGWLSGCLGLRVKGMGMGRGEGGRLLSSCSFLSSLMCMCVCVWLCGLSVCQMNLTNFVKLMGFAVWIACTNLPWPTMFPAHPRFPTPSSLSISYSSCMLVCGLFYYFMAFGLDFSHALHVTYSLFRLLQLFVLFNYQNTSIA